MPWLEDLKFPRGYQMGTHISNFVNSFSLPTNIQDFHLLSYDLLSYNLVQEKTGTPPYLILFTNFVTNSTSTTS